MTFNPHWSRWVRASLTEHLRTRSADIKGKTVYRFFEGEQRQSNEEPNWFEIRVDGPFSQEETKDRWTLRLQVNILCCAAMANDLYYIDRMTGLAASWLNECISIYKYGDDPAVDNPLEQIGILQLVSRDKNEGISIQHYGQIESKTPLVQATVECEYWTELER